MNLWIVWTLVCMPAGEPRTAYQDTLDRLTGHRWVRGEPGASGFQEYFELYRSGEYRWHRVSDVVEIDDAGHWVAMGEHEDHVLLLLSDTGALSAVLNGDTLRLDEGDFAAGDPLPEAPDEPLPERAVDLTPPETWNRLAGRTWHKTNELDNYRLPTSIHFHEDGRLSVEYRHGECRADGSWSVVRGALVCDVAENDCDQRGGSAGLSTGAPFWIDDLLVFNGSYCGEPPPRGPQTFFFSRYGGGVLTRGDIRRPLVAGVANQIEFEFMSRTRESFRLNSVRVSFRGADIVERGINYDDEIAWQTEHDFDSVDVERTRPHRCTIDIVPPEAGLAFLEIQLSYTGRTQDYDAPQTFVLTIDSR